mgnify:CR=1 FL=1
MKYLFAITFLFFTACSKKVDCPSFDTSYLTLMPYQNGDSIIFSNGTKDIKFIVSYKEYTNVYSEKCSRGGMLERMCPDCEAVAEMIAYSDENRNNKKRLRVELSTLTRREELDTTNTMEFQVLDYLGGAYGFSSLVAKREYFKDSIVNSISANGKSYSNVLMHTLDTLTSWSDFNKNQIWRVYLTTSEGIIGFSDRQTQSTYFLK